ncbi:hypothetical protein ABPG74_006447 [Tetrahymena malaccensis]
MDKRSIPNQPVSWQHPFVDVFRKFCVFDSSNKAKKGGVADAQDNNIGRRVLRIAGAVSASNYLNIPDPAQGLKSLQLVGRYLIIEFLPCAGKYFHMHFDFNISNREPITRFSISNMFDQYKVVGNSNLQIPYPSDAPVKWTVMVLDIQYHLENFGLFQHTDISNFANIHQLRSIQLCSTLSIRGVFTSDVCYSVKNLPKELDFKPPKDRQWSGTYQIVYYPSQIDPDLEQNNQPPQPETLTSDKENQQNLNNDTVNENRAGSVDAALRQSQKSFRSNKSQLSHRQSLDAQNSISGQLNFMSSNLNASQKFHPENLVRHSQVSKRGSQQELQNQLQPYPICKLNHTVGFSGNQCPDIKWSRHLERPDEIIYASGSVLVSSELGTKKQRFFQGHTSPISCLDVSRDGVWIVSAQDGKPGIVMIWNFITGDLVTAFQCPQVNIKCISFSYNRKLLATVGLDSSNRELIIILNIDNIEITKKPTIVTKQISDFNILSLKFFPVNLNKLVSCGRENIRFWRINKTSHLRGTPLILNGLARNSIFTVLDFEYAFDNPSAAQQKGSIKKIYVGSKQGVVFQISYNTNDSENNYQLETLYQCHAGAITSLCLSAGFCATGSEDKYIRIWPLNFTEFLIEAKHEGVVISLDISLDSLKIACGTSNGILTVFDRSTYQPETFLRSHTDEITQMLYHPFCNYLITLSSDFTIRLWDMEKYEQVYEFPYYPEDNCITLSCSNSSMTFAAGFNSGVFRVFDIEKTNTIFEGRYHESRINHIQYSPDDKHLIAGDENGFYCLYDVQRNYQPVKTFEREIAGKYQFSAFTYDGELLAMIGDCGTHINIVDTYTMSNILKIFCANTTVKKLMWSSNNTELFAITDDSKVKVFGIDRSDPQNNEAHLLREISCVHRNGLNDISLSSNFKYMASVGGDKLLKIWDYEFLLNGPGSNQVFLSHINKINCIAFSPDNTKIITAGGFEGIYEWNFLGDLTKQERIVDFSENVNLNTKKIPLSNSTYQPNPVKRANKGSEQLPLQYQDGNEGQFQDQLDEYADIQQVLNVQRQGQEGTYKVDRVVSDVNDINPNAYQQHGSQPPYFEVSNSENSHPVRPNALRENQYQGQRAQSSQSPNNRDYDEDSDADHIGPLAQLMSQAKNLTGYNQSKKSNSILSAASNAPRFQPTRVEPVKPQEIEYHKQKKKRERKNLQFKYTPNEVRKENNIPFRHYYAPNCRSETFQEKNLKLRDNKEEFQTEYIISFNNESHDNVVWNYMAGWFAYSSQNLIIIENLTKVRKQRIINLPDQISCLTISKDFKFLVAGSASYNQSEISNIYVIDCKTSEIVKTLGFHTRGVQSIAFSSNRKYIISAGNCKECTIAIWEWPSGKLITSSYTIDRINDVKISEIVHTVDNQLEFCTVGRDTVQFWALDKTNTLKYFDVFVPKQEFVEKSSEKESSQTVMKAPEVTAVDYILFGSKQYAVAGLSTGEIIVVDNENFQIVYRTQVSLNGQEVLDVRVSNQVHRLIVTTMDENIHYWDFERQLQASNPFSHPEFMISWARLKVTSSVTSFSLDPTFKEGLVGLYHGSIYYVNLDSKYRTVLIGTIDNKYSYDTHIVNERFIVTTHQDGKMKLWNIQTAEEVMEYKFQSAVKSVLFESKTNKIFCFFENNNDIKSINLQKFFQSETYVLDEVRPSDKTSTEYPIKSFETIVGGRSGKFVVMKSGDIFNFEQLIKDKRPLIRFQKVFKVPNVTDFIPYSEKSLFFATTSKGKVIVYLVDYASDRQIGYGFTLIDECDFLENPHGSLIDSSAEQKNLTQLLYTDAVSTTKIAVSRFNDNVYYAINSTLQYVFVRNYQKRQILQRINLHDFPLSITLMESKNSLKMLVGLSNGSFEKLNVESKEDRELYTGTLDGGITNIYTQKSNNPTTNIITDRIVASSKDGIAIYSLAVPQ